MRHLSVTKTLAAVIASAALVLAGCSSESTNSSAGGEGSNFPTRDLSIIAGGGPGGGLDTASRQLVSAINDAGVEAKFNIINNAAGNGNAARAAMLAAPNDGYTVVADSNRVILNPMIGSTDLQLEDFTPIAQLTVGDVAWVVGKDSPFKTAEDVINAVKNDVSSVTFGVGSTPSNEQLNVLLPLRDSGVDDLTSLNIVNFLDGGSVNTELLGGRIDVASTGTSEAAALVESGDFRALATSGPDRYFEDTPTWKELGIDVEILHLRGIIGPKDMPEEAKDWWIDAIRKATETEEWKTSVENVGLESAFLPSDEFQTRLEEERDRMLEIYTEIGLVK